MRWKSLAAVAANALVFGIVLAEGLTRLALTDFYRCDDRLGWVFEADRSGFRVDRGREYALRVKINRAGFRDVEHDVASDPATIRIVLLGDSMLAELQVPLQDTFARRLEEILDASAGTPGVRFEILNCATDGYGTAQQLLTFRERCAEYQPDLVVLGTFLWNDLADNHPAVGSLNHPIAYKCGRPYFTVQDEQLIPAEDELAAVERSPVARVDGWLRNSYLYQIVVPPPGRSQRKFGQKQVFRREQTPELAEAWRITDALIRALAVEVQAHGARLVVMPVPSRLELEGRTAPAAARLGADADLEHPHQQLLALLAAAQIPTIDPNPTLKEAMRNESAPPYFRRDLHWTAQGNDVMAHFVAEWIGEHCDALGLPERACAKAG